MTDQRGAVFLCFFHPSFSSLSPSQFFLGAVFVLSMSRLDQLLPCPAGDAMWPALSVAPCPMPILLQPAARVLRVLLCSLFASYSVTGLADHHFLYSVVSRYLKLNGNRLQSWTLCSHSSVLFKQFSCLAFPLLLSVKNFFSCMEFNKEVYMNSQAFNMEHKLWICCHLYKQSSEMK